uniref:Cysteine dioxygenase type I n=1 Tax=Megaviridae environmental sample TaxID=1737588 RepID=A0A5J6VKA1_9VIRU|nr:MAG: cysteine dioxygenase type I [Megaviridae environmental sample]
MLNIINFINLQIQDRVIDLRSVAEFINKITLNINYFEKYNIKNDSEFEKITIYKNLDYELVLINWKKNYNTDYHNHPKNGCVMKILKGELQEDKIVYQPYKNIFTKKYKKNDTGFIKGGEIHNITALEDSISLHIYSPPDYYKN